MSVLITWLQAWESDGSQVQGWHSARWQGFVAVLESGQSLRFVQSLRLVLEFWGQKLVFCHQNFDVSSKNDVFIKLWFFQPKIDCLPLGGSFIQLLTQNPPSCLHVLLTAIGNTMCLWIFICVFWCMKFLPWFSLLSVNVEQIKRMRRDARTRGEPEGSPLEKKNFQRSETQTSDSNTPLTCKHGGGFASWRVIYFAPRGINTRPAQTEHTQLPPNSNRQMPGLWLTGKSNFALE